MDRAKLKIFIAIALGIAVGFAVGFGWGHVRLQSEQKMYTAKIKDLNRRLSQAQSKYSQDIAQQTVLEDEKRAALEEVEKIRTEKKVLKSKADSLDAKSGQLTERLAKVETERNSLDKKEKQDLRTIEERDKEIKQLVEIRQRLQNELKRVNQRYDRCVENNAGMYIVASEILHRYEGKGFKDRVLEKEPFTQIKKVELERLVQEYRDKIDAQKMRTK
ncbi:MAG: Chromosome partition protein Smc [Syntrophorhabdus sp. PtaU1.Bin058]|nr:MAG: Chromosome partition protein Smc [Syntrophorhabdus sp. PtaU1.Bin058]